MIYIYVCVCEYLKLNMFTANPRLVRCECRISFDIIKALRVNFFTFHSNNPQNPTTETLNQNPKS